MSEKDGENRALLDDVPVLEAGREDHLEFSSTARVLADAAVATLNPLTIGIFGEWGAGKTSLMKLIEVQVEEMENAAAVWFNAWQYEKEEHLIVPLIATINKELKKKHAKELERARAKRKWSDAVLRGAKKTWVALQAIAYGFSIKGKIGIPLISEAEVNLSPKDMIERYQSLTKDTMLARSLYFDAFEELAELTEENEVEEIEAPRIVVFVDDLDRCFPDKAVELLEGIKLVLHQRGFSFVLGVNDAVIRAFINTKYRKDYQIEASHFEDYLDKIVQVKVPVPPRIPEEMSDYIVRLLDDGHVFAADAEYSTADMIPLIAEAGKRNPRSIVRLLNRIIVTSRISALELERKGKEKAIDPLALLLDMATDEARYKDLRAALDVNLPEEAKKTGQFLASNLERYGEHVDWIAELRTTAKKLESPSLEKAIKVLDENEHLCNLLESPAGRRWLSDKDYRETHSAAAKRTEGDRKEEPPSERKDPIRQLLDNMVRIEGTGHEPFRMGSEENDSEKPVHPVTLYAFEIGATPVTQAQYEAVMGTNPSEDKGPDNPVANVSWLDATEFCEKLSARTGDRFTLPTEAQWEYACRERSREKYCFGDAEERLGDYAWYAGNSGGKTHPVGQKWPNARGLYDMHGSVFEWCLDWWHEDYTGAPDDGSAWESPSRPFRLHRGGYWNSHAGDCRSASRSCRVPRYRGNNVGVRLVRTL